jgi:putative flippase GtrA
MMNNVKERNRFLKFAVVGAIGAVIDFSILILLKTFTPMDVIWASVISFTSAVVSNFLWNRFWTFPESRKIPLVPQILQFSIVSVAGLAIRTPLFAWLNDFLTALGKADLPPTLFIPQITPEFLGRNVALASVILIVMLWNFFVNRFWTYKKIQ